MTPEQQHRYEQVVLPQVNRPGRYVGGEFNSVRRDEAEVHLALAFPDVYEVGMSYTVGFGILYHTVNQIPWAAAERVYAPWVDMMDLLQQHHLPLASLETRRALHRFDLVGFTLQYELHYSNILRMLDLGGIPRRSRDRSDNDPLVIAGGPVAFNAEPVADFFDAMVVGDGEESLPAVLQIVRQARAESLPREELLVRMLAVPGVYVPSFYQDLYDETGVFAGLTPTHPAAPLPIIPAQVRTLAPKNYPDRPVIPNIDVEFNRLSVEVMRGCSRGCRFCHAGMVYRPVRQRPVVQVRRQISTSVENTGHSEVSLLSLSTSDWSGLTELIEQELEQPSAPETSLSFPSLRPEMFTESMADAGSRFRRSGLTFAPEAGTDRLRRVINKTNREDDLIRAVDIAFSRGWRQIKLYFMIGLPTETDEDLAGIVYLANRVVTTGKPYGRVTVKVSVSPHSPKPHTPFQWEAQDTLADFERKIEYIRSLPRRKGVQIQWRDPHVSQLECTLARGDRRLSVVIERAVEQGARFDAWSEQFDYTLWADALNETGLSLPAMTRARDLERPLPWDHLHGLLERKFLLNERELAYAGQETVDCREDRCHRCGTCDADMIRQVLGSMPDPPAGMRLPENESRDKSAEEGEQPQERARVRYRKVGAARFLGHLDVLKHFERGIRLAGMPVARTRGFRQHDRVSFGPPLPLGFTSDAEFMDLLLTRRRNPADIFRFLPDGLEFHSVQWLPVKAVSITAETWEVDYSLHWSGRGTPPWDELEQLCGQPAIPWVIVRKKKEKHLDLKINLNRLIVEKERVILKTLQKNGFGLRPDYLYQALPGQHDLVEVRIHKLDVRPLI